MKMRSDRLFWAPAKYCSVKAINVVHKQMNAVLFIPRAATAEVLRWCSNVNKMQYQLRVSSYTVEVIWAAVKPLDLSLHVMMYGLSRSYAILV